jgi:hypothetical protein
VLLRRLLSVYLSHQQLYFTSKTKTQSWNYTIELGLIPTLTEMIEGKDNKDKEKRKKHENHKQDQQHWQKQLRHAKVNKKQQSKLAQVEYTQRRD